MQIKAYLHRYSVSPVRFFFWLTQGIFVPNKIAVLKIAGAHCFLALINSTIILMLMTPNFICLLNHFKIMLILVSAAWRTVSVTFGCGWSRISWSLMTKSQNAEFILFGSRQQLAKVNVPHDKIGESYVPSAVKYATLVFVVVVAAQRLYGMSFLFPA